MNVCNTTPTPCGNNSFCFWVPGSPHSCGCQAGYERENRTDGIHNCICMHISKNLIFMPRIEALRLVRFEVVNFFDYLKVF